MTQLCDVPLLWEGQYIGWQSEGEWAWLTGSAPVEERTAQTSDVHEAVEGIGAWQLSPGSHSAR